MSRTGLTDVYSHLWADREPADLPGILARIRVRPLSGCHSEPRRGGGPVSKCQTGSSAIRADASGGVEHSRTCAAGRVTNGTRAR